MVYFKTWVNGTSILDFYLSANFSLIAYYDFGHSYNYKIDNISISYLNITQSTYGPVNNPTLFNYIGEAISGYLENSNFWSLFKRNIDISTVLREITFFEENDFGVQIGGSPKENRKLKFEGI